MKRNKFREQIFDRKPFLKFLYKAHNILKNEVLKITQPVALTGQFITLYFYWFFTKNIWAAGLISLGVNSILFAINKIIWIYIQKAINNTGFDTTDIILTGEYLLRGENGEPSSLKVDMIDERQFELATEDTAMVSALLNVEAYKYSLWSGSVEEKYSRNLSHIIKNDKSILFIKSLTDNSIIGFTHMLPVTEAVWKRYQAGKIGDSKFSAKQIFPSGPNLLGKPYGLILFSVALAKRNKDFTNPKTYRKDIGILIEQALVYHSNLLLESQFDKEVVPVMLQNMDKVYIKFFKDSATIEKVSKDGALIIEFEIQNQHLDKDKIKNKSKTA